MLLARDRLSARFCVVVLPKELKYVPCTCIMASDGVGVAACFFPGVRAHIHMNRCLVLSNDMPKCRHFSGPTFAQLRLLNCEPFITDMLITH
jgi:hypothetical protein